LNALFAGCDALRERVCRFAAVIRSLIEQVRSKALQPTRERAPAEGGLAPSSNLSALSAASNIETGY
jgi:hypothetical protein